MRSCWCFTASVWKGTHRTSHVMTQLHNDDTLYDMLNLCFATARLHDCQIAMQGLCDILHRPVAWELPIFRGATFILAPGNILVNYYFVKSCQVKKRILDELEVPREAYTHTINIYKHLSTCVQIVNSDFRPLEGVFPLYRDRFTGEMMMFLRQGLSFGQGEYSDPNCEMAECFRIKVGCCTARRHWHGRGCWWERGGESE